ncbi:hypothetical protein H5154_17690 [Pseudoalteromonas sp. SR44-5]|uniref:Uncharacterized protein n=1 Tax=Pseudoalteromonas aliena TaxID=247523 RepID=A0A1Q2GUZ2_9GAMM|nr:MULTISPECIES: hypothetical protein [Pseudoalteromonas]AQP98926.1 hypothetical protein B0W48_03410 [Pseudoalteromonas aliena]MBB1295738.1 hypothetical protein [Pseudoalteromonas sp. SR41-4]MBB1343779.1 hypothetical protein [Pseudoalteromonas sp. SR45-6]MBB1368210.1 hypothetical protein [Pseudoalteromonas sp. SR44-5]MBB1420021.1 hypothetical protein [Pseudoalteromonas sp. SG44-1]
MTSDTPKDYSEDMYKFYFEVGEWKGEALTIISSFLGHYHSKNITKLEFGYELIMPIQCVPDLVSLLIEKNIAIYQIVRGEKTQETWRL